MTLVPFVIEYAMPNGAYTDQSNIATEYHCIEKDLLHQTFIAKIVDVMYEFCSDYGIEINSYDDFCEKYYKEKGRLSDAVFCIIRYYLEDEWHVWEPEINQQEIQTIFKNNL